MGFLSTMSILVVCFILTAGLVKCDQLGNLDSLAGGFLTDLVEKDAKLLSSKDQGESEISPLKKADGPGKTLVKPIKFVQPVPVAPPSLSGVHQAVKTAVPLKKVALKKGVVAKKLVAPKVKTLPLAALKKKPKVHALKPIVHVIEKPVNVYHKVPVPKKVIVPKFYPVIKPIPMPKIVYVPYKVPVKKIIPKIVKIPKPIPVPKFIPVKKPIPIGIPYPMPKIYKFPVPKPVPYAKYIPIPVPKKVPKFIPVPVKKVIKVPKPYYVPVKVPHVTTSFIKAPMTVDVPDIKKIQPGKYGGLKNVVNFIPGENKNMLKFLESAPGKTNLFGKSVPQMPTDGKRSVEDKELMKLLSEGFLEDSKV